MAASTVFDSVMNQWSEPSAYSSSAEWEQAMLTALPLLREQAIGWARPAQEMVDELKSVAATTAPTSLLCQKWQMLDTPAITYKRISHIRERLRQLQGKCAGEVPSSILTQLRSRLATLHIPTTSISTSLVKKLLKELKLSKWYEYKQSICHSLDPAFPLLEIPNEHEEQILCLFLKAEAPFNTHRHHFRRKNFMSYGSILYKICELLGYTYILPHIELLKSINLMLQQQSIWKMICTQCGWEYIPFFGNMALEE